jgi:hypothetical protein
MSMLPQAKKRVAVTAFNRSEGAFTGKSGVEGFRLSRQ